MFQVLEEMSIQQETQPAQAPTPNFSMPPLHVNIQLRHQQAEMNRLKEVMQQWSTKGLHQ